MTAPKGSTGGRSTLDVPTDAIVHVDHDRLGQDRSKVGFEITEERGQTSGPRWVVGCRVGNV
ncbi:MAG: hypothetical protein V9G12_19590 [Microthrixaceae bacterium]